MSRIFVNRNKYGTIDVFFDGSHGRRWLGHIECEDGMWSYIPVSDTVIPDTSNMQYPGPIADRIRNWYAKTGTPA